MKRKKNRTRYREATPWPDIEAKEEWREGPPLPGAPGEPPAAKGGAKLNGGFADSAFADNKHRPVHRWVPWIAGFSAEFVKEAFARYLPRAGAGVVLDPFCGVGTTVFEAVRCGHDAIGFEINPYAALAAQAKCDSMLISPPELEREIGRFVRFMANERRTRPGAMPPEFFRSRIPFFGAQSEIKALRALGFIQALPASPIRDLFSLAFGSVMVSLSNYSYEPSLSSRPAVGKNVQPDAPVAETMLAKLAAMKSDVGWFRAQIEGSSRRPRSRIIQDSFLNALSHLEPASVDLIVTSPPYLNNYHYVRNTRPQLFWLGFIRKPSELKRLETVNFGKYWQTVRDLETVPLEFEHRPLERLLEEIRAINTQRGSYGGRGWANYAASYFNDTANFCRVMRQTLKPGGWAVIVVGNSILQGIEIPVDNILSDLAGREGLRTEAIHIVRQKRVGASIVASSVRQGVKTTAKLYESAVILRQAG